MAGLVGFIAAPGAAAPACLERSLEPLLHHRSFETITFIQRAGLFLGAAYRPQSKPTIHSVDENGLCVVIYGQTLQKNRSWKAASAAELAHRIIAGGLSEVFDLDGSFVVVVVDHVGGRVDVINDRVGSIPIA